MEKRFSCGNLAPSNSMMFTRVLAGFLLLLVYAGCGALTLARAPEVPMRGRVLFEVTLTEGLPMVDLRKASPMRHGPTRGAVPGITPVDTRTRTSHCCQPWTSCVLCS